MMAKLTGEIFILYSSEDPFDDVDVDAEIFGNPTKV
jgi:hypothetical protein